MQKLNNAPFELAMQVALCAGLILHVMTGLEIATHWSPMRPKIECWRLDFQNWSPAGDSRSVR